MDSLFLKICLFFIFICAAVTSIFDHVRAGKADGFSQEIERSVLFGNPAYVSAGLDGEIVLLSGEIKAKEAIYDRRFNHSIDALIYERKMEGKKYWSIMNGTKHPPSFHTVKDENGNGLSTKVYNPTVYLGAYKISTDLLETFLNYKTKILPNAIKELKRGGFEYSIKHQSIYIENPAKGYSMGKWTFRVVPSAIYTVIVRVKGDTLYSASTVGISYVFNGNVSLSRAREIVNNRNNIYKFLFRLASLVLFVLSFMTSGSFVKERLSRLPLVGSGVTHMPKFILVLIVATISFLIVNYGTLIFFKFMG